MTRYDVWNNAIYNYYFEGKNLSSDFLFFVDENILKEIGKNFGTEDVIQDFCKCIRNRITYNDKIDLEQSHGVSYSPKENTAIIAFFIYIASCLGEKQIDNFIDSYWEICASKLNISKKSNQSVFEYNAHNKKKYFDMFNKFAEFINKNHGLNFKFNSLYKRSEGQSDYIGLPISQSMFSTKDRYLLSQVFDKYEDKKIDYIYHYMVNNLSGYSKILKKLCFDPKYSEKIKEILKYLRENWDYVVVEIDDYSKTGSRVVSSPLLIGFYKTKYGDFKLGVTTYNKGYENLIFRYKNIEYELSQRNNTKFYPLNTVFFEQGNSIFYNYSFATNHKIQLKNKPIEKNFILLTKAEDGSYIQNLNNYVMQNTYFSILGTREFFENDYEDYFGDYVEELKEPCPTLTKNIYVVTDLFAESYDNEYIKLSTKNKVRFKKGLKIDRNTYVEGAGPTISINDLSNVEILDNIRKTVYKNSNAHQLVIDESKDYEIGTYKITCNYTEIGESFAVNDISMVEANQSDESIYHTFQPTGIRKIYSDNEPAQYISGAFICGFKVENDKLSENTDLLIEKYKELAEEYNDNEQYELAIKNLKKALALVPNDKDVINNLVNAYYNWANSIKNEDSQTAKKYYAKAVEYYNKVLKLNSEYEIDYFNLAYAQYETGDKSSALKNYQKDLETHPYDSVTHNNIGVIYKDNGEYDKALQYYQKAHELDPADKLYIKNLAVAYNSQADRFFKNKKYKQAIKYYNEVLKLNPEYEIDYFNLACAQDEVGDTESALKNYQKDLETHPYDSKTHNNIGVIYQNKGDCETAVKYYQKAHELNPEDKYCIDNLANIYYNWAKSIQNEDSQTAKQYCAKAVEYYNKVLKLNPEYEIDYCNLAYAQYETGDKSSALKNCQKYLETHPDDSETHNNIGVIYTYNGEYDKALQYFQKAIELDPNNTEIQNNFRQIVPELTKPILQQAHTLDGEKNYKRMYELACDALQRGIETAEIYHIAGYALFRQYNNENNEAIKDKAVNCFKRAYEMVQNGQYYNDEVAKKIELNYINLAED